MPSTVESPATLDSGLRSTLFGEDHAPHPALLAAGAIAVVAGVVLRFWAPTPLWLDETLSVNIAKLPVSEIPRALSHDGAPPLYYVLLHWWMSLFGTGNFAVRALSGVISVASLPLFWLAGRELGGRKVAWATFLLALASPFAITYATSARMYSLMVLWSLLGYLAVRRALDDPSRGRLAAVAGVTALLPYTHYWGLYLVLVAAGWLYWTLHRTGRGRKILQAMLVGGLLWLPWSFVFAYQALHTGTPWTSAAGPADLLGVFSDFSGPGAWGGLVMFATFALFLVGTFGRSAAPGTLVTIEDADGFTRQVPAGPSIVMELKPRPGMGPLVGIAVGTLAVAVVLGALANAAFVARYTAVVLPLFLLVVATGVAIVPGRRFRAGCLAVLTIAGLASGLAQNDQARTQAGQVAAVLNAQGQSGDLVLYCPDQLGPAVDRLLHVAGIEEITFPRSASPQRVDWVDYRKVVAATDVDRFAQAAIARVGTGHTIWFVWRDGYPGLGGDCGYLKNWLDLLRAPGVTVIRENSGRYYEYENVSRYSG